MKRLLHLAPLPYSLNQTLLVTQSSVLLCALLVSTLLTLGSHRGAKAATCVNLVVDSSLEDGSTWVTKSSGNYPVLSNRLPHSGKQAAYLAGANHAHDLLATTIKLPANQQSFTLSFWWQIQSQESGRYQDNLTVGLVDSQGKTLQTLDTLSSRDMSNQWQQRTLTITRFAGQTVQLQFVARTDAESATDFFVDDIELIACS